MREDSEGLILQDGGWGGGATGSVRCGREGEGVFVVYSLGAVAVVPVCAGPGWKPLHTIRLYLKLSNIRGGSHFYL